jgi:hypothetical protein
MRVLVVWRDHTPPADTLRAVWPRDPAALLEPTITSEGGAVPNAQR